LEAIEARQRSDPAALELALRAYRFSFRTSYDQLICLPTLRNIQSFWYQEETARKVMKNFRGRAILADEVGFGKTIEAGLILKEYMMRGRGLVRSVLILIPSSLVRQWQGEFGDKFDIPFVSTNDPLFKQDPERFWKEPFILASIQTAKTGHLFETVTARTYDMVIVDEAHHVKNRTTLNWKLVNAIQKTFLLMLTATPAQNSLEELYNLVTLLRPGHLKTQKTFKEEFVTRGNPTDPRNREKLRGLLKEVMVRNTRSVTQLHLPPRFATTVRIAPSRAEEEFYQAVSRFVSEQASGNSSGSSKLTLRKLLEAAGSSHAAALRMLERMEQKGEARVAELLAMGRRISMGAKAANVVELLNASPDQKIVFVNYTATLEHLEQILRSRKIPYVVFQGSLTAARKQEAIEAFRGGRKVLLATGTGGEGHNLQFCHVMLNYDLPWNPMEIEQRIGRIHIWVNAALRVSSRAEARATYMVLVCHYVALSDERKEGLVQVGIHEGSGAAVEGLEEQWKDFHPVYFPAGRVPPHFPVHLDQALSRAMIHAREATQRELADFISSMERRLHRDVKNTREYYEALKSEMEASLAHPNLTDMQRRERTEKIQELPLEMERKIRDLEQKYQVQVNVTARAATRLLVDVVQLMVEVKHRKLRRQIRLIWNPVTYRMDPLVCERCGATITTIHLEEKGSEIELLCFPCSRKK
jgi:superfamily II DNA or RNA helicase